MSYSYTVNFEFPLTRMAEALERLTVNIPDWAAYPTLANLKDGDGGLFLYGTIDYNDGKGVQVRGVCHSKASPRAWQGFCNEFDQDCVATHMVGGHMGFIPRDIAGGVNLEQKYGKPSLAEFVTFQKAADYIAGRIEL